MCQLLIKKSYHMIYLARLAVLLLALGVYPSCHGPDTSQCTDDLLCPFDTQCADLGTHSKCVPLTCGDGIIDEEFGESCDDGNTLSGDGCRGDCESNETCGNGVVDLMQGEACDGEGCESGCWGQTCGNSIVDTAIGEVCDDGNAVAGPDCSADCRTTHACGDGQVGDGEQCDDGNTVPGDGCTDCRIDGFPSCSWAWHGRGYYLFCDRSVSWMAARNECTKRGYQLAKIESLPENQFLAAHIGGRDSWIGLNDRDTEGDEVWADGSPLEFEPIWSEPQPNAGTDCVMIDKDGAWDDVECSGSLPFICEGL